MGRGDARAGLFYFDCRAEHVALGNIGSFLTLRVILAAFTPLPESLAMRCLMQQEMNR